MPNKRKPQIGDTVYILSHGETLWHEYDGTECTIEGYTYRPRGYRLTAVHETTQFNVPRYRFATAHEHDEQPI